VNSHELISGSFDSSNFRDVRERTGLNRILDIDLYIVLKSFDIKDIVKINSLDLVI